MKTLIRPNKKISPLFSVVLISIVLSCILFIFYQSYPTEQYAAGITTSPVGQTGNWSMIFDDEFQGTALDTSKWNTCYVNGHVGNGCQHGELEVYLPNEVLVNNGLTLRAEKKTVQEGGSTFNYTSGMISTGPMDSVSPAKFSFKYGYMETRAKVPKGKGLWPAFWTLPSDNSWPPEIDTFEILGDRTNVINMHYHYPPNGDSGSIWTAPFDFSSDYHIFGLDWEPNAITWYVDGVQRAQYTNSSTITAKPMYLLANLAVGGSWPGAPDATTVFPSDFQINYIRVWQKGNVTGSISPTPLLSPTQSATISQNGGTNFATSICPHGLGICGDNANPNSAGNISPKHPSRTVILTALNNVGQQVATGQGIVSYMQSANNFQGNITIPNLSPGMYLISVKTDGFLSRQIPGILTVTNGQTNSLPMVTLIAGDINNDHQLDILDYNVLINCFGSKQMTSSCTNPPNVQSAGADITDDGVIDGSDYNLFLRELSVQKGN